MLKKIRLVMWALVAVCGVAFAVAFVALKPTGTLPLAATIGGPFTLPSTKGGTLSSEVLKGKPFALFFGFTYCPDVCPTTLLDMTNAIKQLGADADRMNYVFVSVDPERDTVEQLKLYLSSFDARIVGVTGSEAQIAQLARSYRAIYEKVKTKDGYTVNHTATTYLMNEAGQFRGTLAYQENHDIVVQKLRRLIAGS